ncbi:hypothetical protein [Bacillus cereus]|uniref:hypothetical protein n=1 Tax=Bacillus cereus TaxID=1396 RepID=UPI00095185D3|nr:hypothetical protein [Bacillus cereus]OLR22773.1 hypothetical protein BLD50_26385 [Bacillus cereus]
MNKSLSSGSNQLLQEIDQEMRIIESMLILRYISGHVPTEEAYEVHQMLLEVSQLLLTLEQESKLEYKKQKDLADKFKSFVSKVHTRLEQVTRYSKALLV